MKPFDRIDRLERIRALDAPARGLRALSHLVSASKGLRSVLAGEPFGHSAHPMLVQVPIGAWVSAGWLDCLPRTEKSAAVLTGIGIVGAIPAIAAGSSTTPTSTSDSGGSPSPTPPPTPSHWRARSSRSGTASPVASAAASGSGWPAPPPSPSAASWAVISHTH